MQRTAGNLRAARVGQNALAIGSVVWSCRISTVTASVAALTAAS